MDERATKAVEGEGHSENAKAGGHDATMKKQVLKLDIYGVIHRAVEEGVAYGRRRAYKHTDTPSEDMVCMAITDAVMVALDEIVKWDA